MDLSDKVASNAIARSIGELAGKLDRAQSDLGRVITISTQTHDSVISLTGDVARVKEDVRGLREPVKELNGTVRDHEARLQVRETVFEEQVKPVVNKFGDMRVELARLGAFGGGLGTIAAVAFGVGKAAGWW